MLQKMPKLKSVVKIMFIGIFVLVMISFLMYQAINGQNKATVSKPVDIENVVRHTTYSNQVRVGPQWESPRGLGIGFVWPEERDLSPEKRSPNEEIILGDKKIFESLLILSTREETTVLVCVLLDYKQISFELDGQAGILHEIKILPGGDLEVPIKVKIDKPGIHDLIVLAFDDPYNGSLDPGFRSSFNVDTVGRRARIIAGNDTEISFQLPAAIRGNPAPDGSTLSLGVAFATFPSSNETNTHPSDLERQLYVTQGKIGEPFKFQIWASNLNGQESSDYALVMFKNFRQVPIKDQEMVLLNLMPGEEKILDAEIGLSSKPGVDQLQIIYVFDPYKSILNEDVRAPYVFNSPRIAIEVR